MDDMAQSLLGPHMEEGWLETHDCHHQNSDHNDEYPGDCSHDNDDEYPAHECGDDQQMVIGVESWQ